MKIIIVLLLVVIALTPSFLFNAYSHNVICDSSTSTSTVCDNSYYNVNIYSYIQRKYWDVG